MRKYSIYPDHGAWFVRWSEYPNGKRKQCSYQLARIKDYPKKREVWPLAHAYMARTQRATTVEAGAKVDGFVDQIYFPSIEQKSKYTKRNYRKNWSRVQPYLGKMRLRDVETKHVQGALNEILAQHGDKVCREDYRQAKVTCSAIFKLAIGQGHHPGPNPVRETTVTDYGHDRHRANEAYSLNEVKQFLTLYPSGPIAVAIGLNAFLALREPEIEALRPEDFDGERVHIHRKTKTGNDEWLPAAAPLRRILAGGWEPVNLNAIGCLLYYRLRNMDLKWKGWYAFRRGMATNLYELGVRAEEAALMLRNSPEVVRKHYLKFDKEKKKQEMMMQLEQAYEKCEAPEKCEASVQQKVQ
jgi:integrase